MLCLQGNFAINASQSYSSDVTWQGIEPQSGSQSHYDGQDSPAGLPGDTSESRLKDETHDVRLLNARLDVSYVVCHISHV